MIFRHGKVNWEDFKDLLGERYDEFIDMLGLGVGEGKDRVKEAVSAGKKKMDDMVPDKMKDFYDLMWDKIEEFFQKGSINYEDLKSVFGEKTDELMAMVDKFKEKGKDAVLDSDSMKQINDEIQRLKNQFVGWKDKLCDNCGHKKSLWESIRLLFRDWSDRASSTWSDMTSPGSSKQEKQKENPTSKSSDL